MQTRADRLGRDRLIGAVDILEGAESTLDIDAQGGHRELAPTLQSRAATLIAGLQAARSGDRGRPRQLLRALRRP